MAESKKQNFFARSGNKIRKFFRDMKSELKKVLWPTPKTLGKNSLIAVCVMLASSVVLWGFDKLAEMLVNALFTLVG